MFDLNQLVRPNILKLQAYSSARDEFNGTKATFLDANENPYGQLNRYPDPQQKSLKHLLSAQYNIAFDNIFIGNGSDEIIDLVFRIFCNPGKDIALTFTPTYGMYQVSAGINDVELIEIPLDENFQIPIKGIVELLKNPKLKLIFLCSPNNPTANILRQSDVEFILKNFKGLVIIDEAYIDFSTTESWQTKLCKYPNLLVCQTFSKAWGLAAARVGFAFTNKALIAILNKVKAPYNVSALNQKAAIQALLQKDHFYANKQSILTAKKELIKALKKSNAILKIYPSETNFLLVKVKDANAMYAHLIKKNIVIRNRHLAVKNCLRITVGSTQENNLLIEALKNYNS